MFVRALRILGCVEAADHLDKTLTTRHQSILTVWLTFAVSLVGIIAWLSYIGGRSSQYDDVTEKWESCLFAPSTVVLPVGQLLDTSPLAPLMEFFGVDIENMEIPLGAFVYALVYICVNTTALTALGHLVVALSSLERGKEFTTLPFPALESSLFVIPPLLLSYLRLAVPQCYGGSMVLFPVHVLLHHRTPAAPTNLHHLHPRPPPLLVGPI